MEGVGAEFAEAGEGVFVVGAGGVAFCAGDKLVVLVLGFFDCAEGAEGLGFCCCGVEEGVIFAAVGYELEGDGSGAGAGATKHDVLVVTAKLVFSK